MQTARRTAVPRVLVPKPLSGPLQWRCLPRPGPTPNFFRGTRVLLHGFLVWTLSLKATDEHLGLPCFSGKPSAKQ